MKKFKIGNKTVGDNHPVFIIAEAGVNHNGDLDMAKELVRRAKACGADCIKFQTFKAERLVAGHSPKAAYQLKTTDPEESQLDMLKKMELSGKDYYELFETCSQEGIIFLSTPYNIEDIDFLEGLGVPAYKIASGQAVEPRFLEYAAEKNKPVILSTGMCSLAEVDRAVRAVRNTGNEKLVVLQCTTDYPSAPEAANLRAMNTMRNAFNILAGYSDHTKGLTAATTAAALGASVIERHFTLDKSLPGPDQSSSSDPPEFSRLVRNIREVEKCLGSGIKIPGPAELKNAAVVRRSIAAKRDIPAGTLFSIDNLTCKRPASGLPAKHLNDILGRKAACDINAGTILDFGMINWT